MNDKGIEIRLIIKNLNYYFITDDLSDIKFNLTYKNISHESAVYWKYTNGLPYNWKFLISDLEEEFLDNDIKIVMSDENIIEDNVILGDLNINIEEIIKFYTTNIKLRNLNHQIKYSDLDNVEKLQIFDPMKFPELAPGLYINKINKNILKDGKKVGDINLEILIICNSLKSLYITGEGRSHPNQFPYMESFKKNYRLLIEKKDMEDDLINVINENLSTNDEFQYSKYAEAFSKIINNPKLSLPLIIGIFASRGVGKSHLLNLIEDKVEEDYRKKYGKKNNILKNSDLDNEYNYISIDFNAWIYSGSDVLWAGLVTALYNQIEEYYGVYYTRWFRIEKKMFPNTYEKIKCIGLILLFLTSIIVAIVLYLNSDVQDIWTYFFTIISGIMSIGFFKNIFSISKFFISSFANEIQNATKSPNFSSKLGFMNDVKNEIRDIF